ncbi:MAG: Uma2 family endonuclease [Aggregatilineales bacterium]
MVIQHKRTIDDFEAFIALPEYSERRFELINGEIVEKVTTEEHGVIASNIIFGFKLYGNSRGDRVATEPRHRSPDDETNARLPDVAYTLKEAALPVTRKGAVPQMPTIAVEIKSPTDTYIKLREKAAYYLENGVFMVWLVFPEKRIIEVYQVGKDLKILLENDTISGGDVLPGFEMKVSDVFSGV